MSDAGSPHGQSLGMMKCIRKTVLEGKEVSVVFQGEGASATFIMTNEDAAYYSVGQCYEFKATTP